MIEGLTYLVGIAIMGGFFLLLGGVFGSEFPVIRMLFVMLTVVLAYFVPAAMLDANTICETVVANSTVVDASTTSYGYTHYCFNSGITTPNTFYLIIAWVYYAILGWLTVFVFVTSVRLMLKLKVRG